MIGLSGCVAGGAIRDCLLDRTPKDYDIFLFDTEAHSLMTFVDNLHQHGVKRVGTNAKAAGYTHRYLPVLNAKLRGMDLQFVVSSNLVPGNMHEVVSQVVDRFAFTVSMGACDEDGDFVIPQCTREAMDKREIIVNPNFINHDMNGQSRARMLESLLERGHYLADKLDFTFSAQQKFYLELLIDATGADIGEAIAHRTF